MSTVQRNLRPSRCVLGRPVRSRPLVGRRPRVVSRRITGCLGPQSTSAVREELQYMMDLADALGGDPEKPRLLLDVTETMFLSSAGYRRKFARLNTYILSDPVQNIPHTHIPCLDRYHVAPRTGWINDPNGPVYVNGCYHLFYQHIINGCEWDFGIVWGHAVSKDLVHWEHQPPALMPTPGGTDADGCFSGCCVLDTDGTPIILYTGVRLRSNPECGPLPPPECDLNLPFVETQCTAVADPSDPMLTVWRKVEACIPLPPPNMPLVGWRDPYILERGGDGKEWVMLLGSGIKGKGGCALIYRSPTLTSGWRYDGMLCLAETADTGAMWECPILLELIPLPDASGSRRAVDGWRPPLDSRPSSSTAAVSNGASSSFNSNGASQDGASAPTPSLLSQQMTKLNLQQQPNNTHLLCVSPDAPTNPVLYWLGNYDAEDTKFLLEDAKGPLRLDLGDVLYAPNLLTDEKGRHIMWGWLQERRKVGSYDYAGCLSIPRVLYIRGDRLVQLPVPEVAGLRQGYCWHAKNLEVPPEEVIPLQGVAGPALDIEVVMERGSATSAGLLFHSWNAGGEGSAAVVYDWERGMLEAVFEGGGMDLASLTELDPEDEMLRRVGGPVDMRVGENLTLRILLDHSCIEVYCGSGEVLSTRIYRGYPPPGADAGVDFVAYGGTAQVVRVEAWEVGSIWQRDVPLVGKLGVSPYEQMGSYGQPLSAMTPIGSPIATM